MPCTPAHFNFFLSGSPSQGSQTFLQYYIKKNKKYWSDTYRNDGVLITLAPPKSCGYLNIRKKQRWPTNIPRSSIIPLKRRSVAQPGCRCQVGTTWAQDFSCQFFSYYMLARGMGHASQDFAMFELNILTIQLHFDFFRLIQLFQKLYKLPTINKIKNKHK